MGMTCRLAFDLWGFGFWILDFGFWILDSGILVQGEMEVWKVLGWWGGCDYCEGFY